MTVILTFSDLSLPIWTSVPGASPAFFDMFLINRRFEFQSPSLSPNISPYDIFTEMPIENLILNSYGTHHNDDDFHSNIDEDDEPNTTSTNHNSIHSHLHNLCLRDPASPAPTQSMPSLPRYRSRVQRGVLHTPAYAVR